MHHSRYQRRTMQYGKQSSRRVRRTAASVLAGVSILALAACGSNASGGSAEGGGKVIVASYGGSFQDAQTKAYFDPFSKESGIKTTGTEGSSFDKLKAM